MFNNVEPSNRPKGTWRTFVMHHNVSFYVLLITFVQAVVTYATTLTVQYVLLYSGYFNKSKAIGCRFPAHCDGTTVVTRHTYTLIVHIVNYPWLIGLLMGYKLVTFSDQWLAGWWHRYRWWPSPAFDPEMLLFSEYSLLCFLLANSLTRASVIGPILG